MNTTKLYDSTSVPNLERNMQFTLISYLMSYFEIQVFFPSSAIRNFLKSFLLIRSTGVIFMFYFRTFF